MSWPVRTGLMWFRFNDEVFLPKGDVVGFFKLPQDEDEGVPRVVAVLRDGRVLESSIGLKALARRFEEGKI